ncbi:hypothetical protein MW871_05825 [Flavobacterium sp. I-SCBP12n]|uniref:DUF5362 domain-containing protein n=2 Tax=Flavobacterium TaxID=237 RepID=A0A9X1XQY7_9FLAO|nr:MULTISPECIES: hypothetical protein [Flavobacterium]MBP4141550.1 hypothetical protein [Flavobacterium flabelliforme]MCK8141408.1 hypothetical protein [Flavobacterium pygoscelis]
MEENSVIESFEMKLNVSAKDFLKETAKWAYFLSIIGYIGIAFLVVIALFAGTLFAAMAKINPAVGMMGASFGIMITVIYLIIAAIYFFPVYYLNKFASNAKLALKNNDSETLATSFGYLKSHYKFIGIMTVIIFSLYLLIFVGMFIAALSK